MNFLSKDPNLVIFFQTIQIYKKKWGGGGVEEVGGGGASVSEFF